MYVYCMIWTLRRVYGVLLGLRVLACYSKVLQSVTGVDYHDTSCQPGSTHAVPACMCLKSSFVNPVLRSAISLPL